MRRRQLLSVTAVSGSYAVVLLSLMDMGLYGPENTRYRVLI
ncbi:MAG: hypothetical protein ACJA07_001500 [Rhodococcus sp. (in: high G+C Gram-positive bacteria)]|jgi:hypothetical protein